MRNGIPRRPVLLAAFLGNLITGDDKHQQDGPLPEKVRADLVATKTELESLNAAVQTSKGQFRQDSKDRRDFVTKALVSAERFRAAVLSVHGPKDPALVDYALATRRKRRKAGSEAVGIPPEVLKAERMKVHLAKMQAQREKAKARQSALDTRIAEQEAKIAKAIEAIPHDAAPTSEPVPTPEPTSPSEPTSSSGTK